MTMTTLERRLERIELALGDEGGDGNDCPTCSPAPHSCFGPWKPAPPNPCPTCGRPFELHTWTLDLTRASAAAHLGDDDER